MPSTDIQNAIYQTLDLMNAKAVREFCIPPATYIGPGAIIRCGDAMAARRISRVFVMADAFLHQQALDKALFRSLTQAGIEYELALYQGGEPDSNTVEAFGKHLINTSCNGVIAFGGGSVIDAAKVTALLAANPTLQVANLLHMPHLLNPHLPLIAIPTTAGTGSEATNVAVITDSKQHIKQVLVHQQLIPDLAIIDACLTLGLPSEITAATGIDALTHAIEAYIAQDVTPLTRGLAYRAITLIGEALPHAVGCGRNVEARESMMLASYMAGMAFSNAGLGLCHAIAHQIGAHYGIVHGIANAIMLPHVMRFNRLVCKTSFEEIGHALLGHQPDDTIDAVQKLIHEVGIKHTLQSYHAKPSDFSLLAEGALRDICLSKNPRTVNAEQIISVLEEALSPQH